MLNEFREDLVSGEWVLFAAGRTQRPELVKQEKPKVKALPKSKCPFEDPEKYGNVVMAEYLKTTETPPLRQTGLGAGQAQKGQSRFSSNQDDLIENRGSSILQAKSGEDRNLEQGNWSIKVAKNKYPAVLEGGACSSQKAGPFNTHEAIGRHEVVIFRDHDKHLHDFSKEELASAFRVYQERYLTMVGGDCGKYALIFHNYGPGAGASVPHPHSQIISIPVLPPDIKRSINGSERFYRENKKRIYDVMIDWERGEKKRVIYENKYFIAFCPFVSKTPYEVRIFPQVGHAHFEKMPKEQLVYLGEILQLVLKKIQSALKNPDYNFFIHTAPLERMTTDAHEFYTWHIEILPKISTFGAFELGSGIDVNIVDPDEAAKLLRETLI